MTMAEKWVWGKAELSPSDAALVEKFDTLPDQIYQNGLYEVWLRNMPARGQFPPVVHLSVKRRDKSAIRDWRHMQRIKNELVGPEYEAVELYPADDRVVDSANQYHLWVVLDKTFRFPFGFGKRFVVDKSGSTGDTELDAVTLNRQQRPIGDDQKG